MCLQAEAPPHLSQDELTILRATQRLRIQLDRLIEALQEEIDVCQHVLAFIAREFGDDVDVQPIRLQVLDVLETAVIQMDVARVQAMIQLEEESDIRGEGGMRSHLLSIQHQHGLPPFARNGVWGA